MYLTVNQTYHCISLHWLFDIYTNIICIKYFWYMYHLIWINYTVHISNKCKFFTHYSYFTYFEMYITLIHILIPIDVFFIQNYVFWYIFTSFSTYLLFLIHIFHIFNTYLHIFTIYTHILKHVYIVLVHIYSTYFNTHLLYIIVIHNNVL